MKCRIDSQRILIQNGDVADDDDYADKGIKPENKREGEREAADKTVMRVVKA